MAFKFSGTIVAVEMEPGTITVGEGLLILADAACYKVQVKSIQVEKVPYDSLHLTEKVNVGLGLTETAKKGSEVYRLLSLPST